MVELELENTLMEELLVCAPFSYVEVTGSIPIMNNLRFE